MLKVVVRKGWSFRISPKAQGLAMLAVQIAALAAAWVFWRPLRPLRFAAVSVLLVWAGAAGIMLWTFLALSMARFPDLLRAAARASAKAMWLAPGALLLASRAPLAIAAGVAAVINATRLLVLSRAPLDEVMAPARRYVSRQPPALFQMPVEQPAFLSRGKWPTLFGALALQAGVCALVGGYPLFAAVSIATVTALWVSAAAARGATQGRAAGRAPYAAAGIAVTFLLTVTLTAVLLDLEFPAEDPAAGQAAAQSDGARELTRRVLQRLAHVPPEAVRTRKTESKKTAATRLVDPAPATGSADREGIPGVILRPEAVRSQRPPLIAPGARLRVSSAEPVAVPFTGEYQLFRTSSGSLPTKSPVEPGTPLESVYRTTNGGPMTTMVVQTFRPPIDLSHCAKVLVTLRSAEVMPVLASMELVAESSVEDGGKDLMGMRPALEETLEFNLPVTKEPLLVHAIRISFQRAAGDRDQNVRIALDRFTLVPRAQHTLF